jgi:adenylate kinase
MNLESKYQSIVIMGKIASGKGTQAQAILEHFGGTLYSNGNKVRETASQDSVFGNKMKEMYESGMLIPEWIASYWMTHALLVQHPNDRVIFEAVAKKPEEAKLFSEIHNWLGRSYIVFNLDITDDEVKTRSEKRSRDVVDTDQRIKTRLSEYHLHTEASIAFFREEGHLVDIDGSLSPEEVTQDIFKHLT